MILFLVYMPNFWAYYAYLKNFGRRKLFWFFQVNMALLTFVLVWNVQPSPVPLAAFDLAVIVFNVVLFASAFKELK